MSDAKEIATAVVEALESSRYISKPEHERHHEYIDSLIDRDTKRAQMYDQVKTHIVKFGAIGVISGLGLAVYHYIRELLHSIPPH